jgi:isocitrate dehydrogenase
LKKAEYPEEKPFLLPAYTRKAPKNKTLVGVDVFLHWSSGKPDDLAKELNSLDLEKLSLNMISNRGIKVWPNGFEETFCTDHWRCRFISESEKQIEKSDIIRILQASLTAGIDVVKTENLYEFDGRAAYSLGQGQ